MKSRWYEVKRTPAEEFEEVQIRLDAFGLSCICNVPSWKWTMEGDRQTLMNSVIVREKFEDLKRRKQLKRKNELRILIERLSELFGTFAVKNSEQRALLLTGAAALDELKRSYNPIPYRQLVARNGVVVKIAETTWSGNLELDHGLWRRDPKTNGDPESELSVLCFCVGRVVLMGGLAGVHRAVVRFMDKIVTPVRRVHEDKNYRIRKRITEIIDRELEGGLDNERTLQAYVLRSYLRSTHFLEAMCIVPKYIAVMLAREASDRGIQLTEPDVFALKEGQEQVRENLRQILGHITKTKCGELVEEGKRNSAEFNTWFEQLVQTHQLPVSHWQFSDVVQWSYDDFELNCFPVGDEGFLLVVLQKPSEFVKWIPQQDENDMHANTRKHLIETAQRSGEVAYLMQVEVRAKNRRQGIASALIEIAEWELRRRHIPLQYGLVMEDNPMKDAVLQMFAKDSFEFFRGSTSEGERVQQYTLCVKEN